MYQNFSFTEACVSEMKTTALCVFALFLSSMLVDGIIYNRPCSSRGACNGNEEKPKKSPTEKPKKSPTEKVGDKGEAGNFEMMKMNIRRRLEEEEPTEKFRDEEGVRNLEMMKMNIRRRLEEAKREQHYRREICLRARELRCGMEQKK
ncbi:hypothetical protein pdam_00000087 [Pocillopora damicornis]|uniref:Uncharacterized protein n=1 Tax=Pocillopora damicornis TaxID=46731 RepID=A0A3M6UX68_POCDA|nr:hypothetical protein pdam_00000087 [Pocillopora damicornis]